MRLVLLALVAAWLLHPFATSRQIGAGDALWYANMLADFCLQWREGIFPVFVGQTEYAFNGAVYPLRVAPLYQHLGGILDLLTGRQLGWFALQHLCVIVAGVAGIFSCYFSLTALAPRHRWTAAALATLYLSCPGLLGTVYTQDLYMTWMTVPFAPLAVYGMLRPFERDTLVTQVILAAALAALWLAHSPVALWMTLLATLIQGLRLLSLHRTAAAWRHALLGAVVFVALAHYPFVSVAALQVPGAASTVTAGLQQSERISKVVREVFPAVLLPLSKSARALSDLQLGYGLWLIALLSAIALILERSLALAAVLGGCVILLVLVLPVPGNEWLWAHLPEQIKRITFYWPMHRFYLLLAALLAGAGQLAWSKSQERFGATIRPVGAIIVVVACVWSLLESRQFVSAGHERTVANDAHFSQRPENRLLMNHSYGLFSALPAYFSNGVVNPRSEVRLLDPITKSVRENVTTMREFQPLRGRPDDNPGILKFEPVMRLQPNHSYELRFNFRRRTYIGILQFSGRGLFREYALPASGESLAFGSTPGHAHHLVLWTTLPEGDEVTVRFIPTSPGETPMDYADFGDYTFQEISSETRAVQVASLLPLRVSVETPAPALLETPRMFQPGYYALLNGSPADVAVSPRGLVVFLLPKGTHSVEVGFRGPFSLRAAYWVALAAWSSLIVGAFFFGWRRIRN